MAATSGRRRYVGNVSPPACHPAWKQAPCPLSSRTMNILTESAFFASPLNHDWRKAMGSRERTAFRLLPFGQEERFGTYGAINKNDRGSTFTPAVRCLGRPGFYSRAPRLLVVSRWTQESVAGSYWYSTG